MPETPEVSSLLDEAASLAARTAEPDGGVGDLRHFLGAYYRHMPVEELVAAGPARLAGVATEHARLAANRPQGRALVRVSAGGMCSALEEQRGAVDIVTDDMPFLVDSITMELTRHGLDSFHIIHPQLLVRRDVTGTLWEVVGVAARRPARARRDRRVVDAHRDRHLLGRVPGRAGKGPAAGAAGRAGGGGGLPEDDRGGAAAHRQAGDRGAQAARRDPGAAALARRQPLHLPRVPRVRPGGGGAGHGAGAGPRHRPGHPAARQARVLLVRGATAGGAGPGQGPAAPHPHQGQLPLHRAPAQLPRLHRDQAGQRDR